MLAEHGNSGSPLCRVILALFTMIVVLALAGPAVLGVRSFALEITTPGPNTVGEAGRGYFARRFQQGETIFLAGDEPPFNPSFHGALLHASVGALGKITGASVTGLYYLGRAVSVAATVVSFLLAGLLLRRLGASWLWLMAVIAVFLGARPVTHHTISYRPDNWILCLSLLECALLVTCRRSWRLIAIAAVIPVIAFFIKATGLAILVAAGLAMVAKGRKRDAIVTMVLSATLLGVTVVLLQIKSGGRFLDGLQSGASVDYSLRLMLTCLSYPQLWLPLFLPAILHWFNRRDGQRGAGPATVIGCFWLISLGEALFTSTRMGANSYYFLQPMMFGLLLLCGWLAPRMPPRRRPSPAAAVLILVFVAQGVPGAWRKIDSIRTDQEVLDIALVRTRRFVEDRLTIARMINEGELSCMSDDPGLNAMLDAPALVHPLVPALRIASGNMDIRQLTDPIASGEYDYVILTGAEWEYFGVSAMPPPVIQALQEHYYRVPSETRYVVLQPIRRSRPGG